MPEYVVGLVANWRNISLTLTIQPLAEENSAEVPY
jgi:hypothetical protein